uniref:Archease domain-containing protein n=1 Tax=Panagrellus redivivus TaxID=6233 RepID=A0A7E4UL58_PANRE
MGEHCQNALDVYAWHFMEEVIQTSGRFDKDLVGGEVHSASTNASIQVFTDETTGGSIIVKDFKLLKACALQIILTASSDAQPDKFNIEFVLSEEAEQESVTDVLKNLFDEHFERGEKGNYLRKEKYVNITLKDNLGWGYTLRAE